MKHASLRTLAAAVLVGAALLNSAHAGPVPGVDYAALVEATTPSVVFVTVLSRDDTPAKDGKKSEKDESRGQGSGFVLDADGHILTNAHVVKDATEVSVTFGNRRRVKARVVGSDTRTDVAVIKVDPAGLSLRPVKVGDPARLRVGDPVAAIGAPFGLENTVTAGIVSAKNRNLDEAFVSFIQTDAAVNPGNSGGPLFNVRGEVIGINSMIYSRTGSFAGLSFAIPIDTATSVARSLIAEGVVVRSRVGLGIQPLSFELAQAFELKEAVGAVVTGVEEGGPADKAGMRPGDIVLKANGRAVEHYLDLPRIVSAVKPGADVVLQALREGVAQEFRMTALKAPSTEPKATSGKTETPATPAEEALGLLKARALTPDEAGKLELKGGIAVAAVKEKSPAARAGVKAGDVVLAVRSRSVESLAELRAALQAEAERTSFPLLVLREGARTYLVVEPAREQPAK